MIEEVEGYLDYFKNINYDNDSPENSGNQLLKILIDLSNGLLMICVQFYELRNTNYLYRTRALEKKELRKLKRLEIFIPLLKN